VELLHHHQFLRIEKVLVMGLVLTHETRNVNRVYLQHPFTGA